MLTRSTAFFRRLTLVQKLSVSVVSIIVLIMIVVNLLIVTRQKGLLTSEMNNSHLLFARSLARDAAEPLIVVDPLRLDEMVRSASQIPGCVYAGVADRSRRIVAHTDRKLLGRMLPAELDSTLSTVMDGKKEVVRNVQDKDQEIKEILIPVQAGHYELIGTALIGFSVTRAESVVEEHLAGLKRSILLISLFVMALGIAGAFGLARVFANPINRLKGKMEQVQSGDFDIDMRNEHLVKCWEVQGCSATDCPAYGAERCWTIPGTMCGGMVRNVAEKICDCRRCSVYRQSCGDEIGELVEAFNQTVSELRKNIAELEKTNIEKSRLEKISALGEMSMTVAHEIKNPLNAIRGAASYLRKNYDGEVLTEFLTVIEDEAKRLNEIVTSFLRFSRPVPLELRQGNLNAVVRETIGLVRHEATDADVEVIAALDDGIPEFPFDPSQFKQALLNLLVNSLDATSPGDTIRITTVRSGAHATVTISDTGSGMSGDALRDAFKPFFTTKTRGSGLGLSCVERIVRDHGGEIGAASDPGKGTTFTFTLPLTPPQGRNIRYNKTAQAEH